MSEHPEFRARELLRALVGSGARFIVVGGVAAQAHGSPILTGDLDICYARDREDLERLAHVLSELMAIRRDMPEGIAAPLDATALRLGDVFTLRTRLGDLDLLGRPDPGLDHEALSRSAVPFEFEGVQVLVAGLDDLIAMKRAAGRPKDRIMLEHLGALREQLDRSAGG